MNALKSAGIALALATVVSFTSLGNAAEPQTSTPQVFYRTVTIDDLDIFYREAGRKDAPTVLLLHGFPTSSHMFRNLIPALADKYHVVAPDYPGFGSSSMPAVDEFEYTFDKLANVVEKFTDELGLKKYSIYLMDYGAPVGFRLAVKHPERIETLIVQNGNAYDEGMSNHFSTVPEIKRFSWPCSTATAAILRCIPSGKSISVSISHPRSSSGARTMRFSRRREHFLTSVTSRLWNSNCSIRAILPLKKMGWSSLHASATFWANNSPDSAPPKYRSLVDNGPPASSKPTSERK